MISPSPGPKSLSIPILFIAFLLSWVASADTGFETAPEGDHFVYIPEQPPAHILVVAHGMLADDGAAVKTAAKYLSRWTGYADKHGLIVIAPVFDTARFGNLRGGYGGYRNLFGRHVAADRFVNNLVDRYAALTTSRDRRFYLYGHSAGGQFANRYTVTHPERIIRTVVSAAGRYSYPTRAARWPYGAGDFKQTIQWSDGASTRVDVSRSLTSYAQAATRITVVVGGKDTRAQPRRPAHRGSTRIEIAQSWAEAMNRNAREHGIAGTVEVQVVPGIGHSSSRLTPHCARVLLRADGS